VTFVMAMAVGPSSRCCRRGPGDYACWCCHCFKLYVSLVLWI